MCKKKVLYLGLIFCLLTACTNDSEKIIGIWQNEIDWFNIKDNKTYDTGTGPLTSFTNLNYTIDPQKKEIVFYTKTAEKSFIVNYKFTAQDTVIFTNKMENSLPITFFKTKQLPTKFQ